MAFPPRFMDELRSRVALPALIGRRVRLVKRGREWTGLCPFHNEKSPSFTVSEDKGFYHCFGCGAHGDAIEYLRRAEGLSFVEAVERLAGEAGLALPEPDPEARQQLDGLERLQAVLEAAADWYRAQLAAPAGAKARHYLAERGLTPETIERFRLGFAPEGRSALKQALLGRGLSEALLIESGMLIAPPPGEGGNPAPAASYDRFRDRVMFPIHDRRGRVIAFGGRAFGDLKPKYLNSPETPLFHKGRVLFNLALARTAAQSTGRLVVAEGYMDVIALAQAGIAEAVAPLGTALTEEQLEALWRLVPEPILCFDGDAAGQRAAARAGERALPLLKAGRSLRFALLPAGEDPDSLLRRGGRAALDEVLARTEPLSDLLWRLETASRPLDTPERRAALERDLNERVGRIGDETVRGYYRDWFRERRRELFASRAPAFSPGGGAKRWPRSGDAGRIGAERAGPELKARAAGSPNAGRERLILALLLPPQTLHARFAEDFAALEIGSPELDRVRSAILDELARNPGLDSGGLQRHLSAQGFARALDRLVGPEAAGLHWFAGPLAALADAAAGLEHVLRRHRRALALRDEFRRVEADLAQEMTEERYARFLAVQREMAAGEGDEAELMDFGVASGRGVAT